jgi:activator of HSP90 ATPase
MKKVNKLKVVQENVNGDNLITSETIEKATEVLQKAQEAKLKECAEEVEQVLSKHGYALSLNYQFVLVPDKK